MSELIGVVVDGEGDFASVKKRFPKGYKIFKTDGPRGHTAKIEDIVKKSKKQLAIIQAFKCKNAVVVLDFEMRSDDYDVFVKSLREQFVSEYGGNVFVVVPNRMIENWYLADIEYLSRNRAFIRDGLSQKSYEGKHGKNELKKCLKNGFSYSETEHGPQLFEIIRFDVARKNSPSLDEFLNYLGEINSNN